MVLFLRCFSAPLFRRYMPKLHWDPDFATLMRAKPSFGLDGMPLVVGLATLLKRFHPK